MFKISEEISKQQAYKKAGTTHQNLNKDDNTSKPKLGTGASRSVTQDYEMVSINTPNKVQ